MRGRVFDGIAMCFFFFQAEDGIRDDLVTGVQTCALPISDDRRAAVRGDGERRIELPAVRETYAAHRRLLLDEALHRAIHLEPEARKGQIGRASCRERV